MKTKNWVILIAVLLAMCAAASLWLLRDAQTASSVEIWSDGVLIDTWSLAVNQSITVGYDDGYNVISVKDGKVVLLALYRNTYIVTESTFDGTTYTIKTLGGKRFSVSVENGVAVMKEIA